MGSTRRSYTPEYKANSVAFVIGCGSFEVSELCGEGVAVAVSGVVVALVLAAEVEAPVSVEVAVRRSRRS